MANFRQSDYLGNRQFSNRPQMQQAFNNPYYGTRPQTPTSPICTDPCDNDMNTGVDSFPLAMAYVPWQKFCDTYELCEALQVGTIFPELNKPFCGKRGVRR